MRQLLIFLIIISLFCSGFTWGKSREERCNAANDLVFKQQNKNFNVFPDEIEGKVAELCHDGAANSFLSGLKNEIGKRPEQAIDYYDKAVAIDEHFYDAYGRKGLLQIALNNKSDAMVSLVMAIEEGGRNPRYHLALAELLNDTNAYSLALYHYKKASAFGIPYTADSLSRMAKAYSALQNWKDAETVTRQALFFSPNDPKLKAALAQIVIHQQRLPEGILLLKQAILLKPDDSTLHRELADALNSSGDAKAAAAELKLAGGSIDDEFESLVNLGDSHFLHRDFPTAIREYTAAAKKHATPGIYQKLGDAYLAVGNDDDALKNYQKSLSMSPNDSDVHYSAGVILERKGEIEKAVNEYEYCVTLNVNNGDALRRLAEIYTLKGDVHKAITEYEKIIHNAPDNPVMHFRLAKVYEMVGNLNDAEKSLQLAIKLDQNNLEPRRELIKLEIKRKNLASAEKLCREILVIDRDDQQERKRLIGILVQEKKYHELTTFLKDEIARYPANSINYYRMGIVREYLKDYQAAIQSFLQSIRINPTALAYQALARSYLGISEKEKAREALAHANRLDPKKNDVKELIELIEEDHSHSKTATQKKASRKKKNLH
ncbi:MAG: tetratricopeptide repeat protein [Desulfuromonadaceae bacterium]|nr:tetratricopeptide repeat protein [Desulfuromonadaceae bacterium]